MLEAQYVSSGIKQAQFAYKYYYNGIDEFGTGVRGLDSVCACADFIARNMVIAGKFLR